MLLDCHQKEPVPEGSSCSQTKLYLTHSLGPQWYGIPLGICKKAAKEATTQAGFVGIQEELFGRGKKGALGLLKYCLWTFLQAKRMSPGAAIAGPREEGCSPYMPPLSFQQPKADMNKARTQCDALSQKFADLC